MQIRPSDKHSFLEGDIGLLRRLTVPLRIIPLLVLGGFVILPSFSARAASVSLAWDPPTNCVDGTPLTDLGGHYVYYGSSSDAATNRIDAGPSDSITVTGLLAGTTYYFVVTAYNSASEEGPPSATIAWNSLDADVNGLPDAWETSFFGDDPPALTPTGDFDEDGVDNLSEFVAGTDPTDPWSALGVVIDLGAKGPVIAFDATAAAGPGYEGKTRFFGVQRSSSLTSPLWSDVTGLSSIRATNQVVAVSVGTVSGVYYRVRAWLE
jgi:hypothetical protein